MSTLDEAPTGSGDETESSHRTTVTGTGRSDPVHVDAAELAAKRAASLLQRALSSDEEARAQVLKVFERLSGFQAQLAEWETMHHALHELLAAFAPFYANLRVLGQVEAGTTNERTLLQGWRPCQARVDRLRDLESSLEHIQTSAGHEGTTPRQPDWGGRIARLRREVEDRLREETWHTEGLIDLADEFHHTCTCYLAFADQELHHGIDRIQRMCTHLLGGLS